MSNQKLLIVIVHFLLQFYQIFTFIYISHCLNQSHTERNFRVYKESGDENGIETIPFNYRLIKDVV